MNSTIGRRPPIAAPVPPPAKPYSVIGDLGVVRRRLEHLPRAGLYQMRLGRFRFGGLLLGGRFLGWSGRGRRGVFAFSRQRRDDGADLDVVGPFRDQNLRDRAFVDRLEFHRRLVGFDLGHDVARAHRVAFLDQPLGERALFHGGRQRRHLDLHGHQYDSTSTSVYSSPGSGSGVCSAKSAASLTCLRIACSTTFSSSSLPPMPSSNFFACSIGSDLSRTAWTSSRLRYLAGSDIEWPR